MTPGGPRATSYQLLHEPEISRTRVPAVVIWSGAPCLRLRHAAPLSGSRRHIPRELEGL